MRPVPRREHAVSRSPWATALPLQPAAPDEQGDLASLALDENGWILDCCLAAERLFNYGRGDLLGRHVSALLPSLAEMPLTRGEHVNPRLAYLSRCCVPFMAARRNGERFACELYFNHLGNPGAAPLLIIVRGASVMGRLPTP